MRWRSLDSGQEGGGTYERRDGRQRPPLGRALARARVSRPGGVRRRAAARPRLQDARGPRGQAGASCSGIGNSATDIAVEASRVAEATFLAMRRGAWIVPKYLGGKPTDELTQRGHQPAAGVARAHRRQAPAQAGDRRADGLRAAGARSQARRGPSDGLLGPAAAPRPRRYRGEAEHRRVHGRQDGPLQRRLERGDRRRRLLHRLQDHVPVLRPRA